MVMSRVIPALLLKDDNLVKTVQFKNPKYIGDPINTVRIFNELEVDELVFLDIDASKKGQSPNYELLNNIANECFMPLAYGGGITSLDQIKQILLIGFEKVVLNSIAFTNPDVIQKAAKQFGNQSIIGSIDVKKNIFKKYEVWIKDGTVNTKKDPRQWAKELESRGVGELLITSINNEGTWKGFDLGLIKSITEVTTVPVIAHGGAGSIADIQNVILRAKVSAAAVGSLVVYQKKGMGVLVNFPDKTTLRDAINE